MIENKPLVSVNQLTRFYGKVCAIKDISFDINRGEILGLLGPNGAGKSTTMQIISGVLSANSGSVSIAGYDIQDSPKLAKKNIGFLPEQLPLYYDLTIDEYLLYAAKLRGIKKINLKEKIDIDQLPQVVNFDLPHVAEDYIHRIGRTGRAGSTGKAVSLVSSDEFDQLKGIERLLKRLIPRKEIEEFKPTIPLPESILNTRPIRPKKPKKTKVSNPPKTENTDNQKAEGRKTPSKKRFFRRKTSSD